MTDGGWRRKREQKRAKSTSDRNVGARRDEMVAAAALPAMAPAMASAMAQRWPQRWPDIDCPCDCPGDKLDLDLSATELVLVGRRAHAPAGNGCARGLRMCSTFPASAFRRPPLPRNTFWGARWRHWG